MRPDVYPKSSLYKEGSKLLRITLILLNTTIVQINSNPDWDSHKMDQVNMNNKMDKKKGGGDCTCAVQAAYLSMPCQANASCTGLNTPRLLFYRHSHSILCEKTKISYGKSVDWNLTYRTWELSALQKTINIITMSRTIPNITNSKQTKEELDFWAFEALASW